MICGKRRMHSIPTDSAGTYDGDVWFIVARLPWRHIAATCEDDRVSGRADLREVRAQTLVVDAADRDSVDAGHVAVSVTVVLAATVTSRPRVDAALTIATLVTERGAISDMLLRSHRAYDRRR